MNGFDKQIVLYSVMFLGRTINISKYLNILKELTDLIENSEVIVCRENA